MSELRKLDWFRVYREEDFVILTRKLKGLYHYNCWSSLHTDKNGNRISIIGYDRKPDSDWGKVTNSMGVWFKTPELADRGEEIIKANAHEGKAFA